ncbi:tRNA (5-methylaminomethyl-2-thiouridine)(34)-methyltransferase MnmD [Phocaeicola coprophilus]|uniref:tRNA (5-methylaminomethyl-2-thiouridine)(34)-methyltransferase MnmD n=1 Tax=Phocaeicola coprophilus TaxID=387090 RepID=UPI00266BEA1E|nr:tRNA (5-methylaminomethyl-2-thiouridine)(34)-methyltransferase MnmD [Phocaeicola coprophilus]
MKERTLEKTADGSYTLFVPEMDEHYHSVKGARTESEHIFINMGLKQSPAAAPHVLEIGFGTGLNAFLTLLEAETSRRDIRFTTLERYPLPEDLIRQMNYPEQIAPQRSEAFYSLHRAAWNVPVQITPHFTLCKIETDFTTWQTDERFDVIYFDAFAPEKQPEMWSQSLFDHLYALLRPAGILTTYCAKGIIRRMLQSSGFHVERLPGPPGGKREILRASKVEPRP